MGLSQSFFAERFGIAEHNLQQYLNEALSAGGEYAVPAGAAENFLGGRIYGGSAGAWSITGLILSHYLALGGPGSFLGLPITDERPTPDSIGRFNHFGNNGSIYWTPSTGAWSIHGAIRSKWSSLGWERSFLGYPVTDERSAPDRIGRANHFSSTRNLHNVDGSIYWTPSTGAHEVHGPIRAKWFSLGTERGCLGYPISDVQNVPGGQRSTFQHGTITYNTTTGAVISSC